LSLAGRGEVAANHIGWQPDSPTIAAHRRSGRRHNCSGYHDGASGVCYVFTRKFALDTLEPLLRLAPKLMGFG
jgi:hypothetical protein